ncbi:hypothetical protein ACO2Q8_08585 [Larkinella sp. VNQ87]|uniref:hypothetical protein n=1 Tax=Larkinella sp. VNQ87 TaxID=3400921 RepID=UPI003BFAB6B6
MEKILNLGRWLFPLSFLLYVGLHFGLPEAGARLVPAWIPFPLFWNYFTGVLITLFIVSCLIGKYDKLATVLMAVYVLLMILLVHIPRAATSENDMLNIFRNLMVIGALLVYAKYVAKDDRLVSLKAGKKPSFIG